MKYAIALVLLASSMVPALGKSPHRQDGDDVWAQWRFLIGDWVGEGGGQPGLSSSAGTTLTLDLQDHVLIRRNYSNYPATKDRPPVSHRDLMVIYRDPQTKAFRAVYWDNEGNVINYTASFSGDGKVVTLTSAPSESSPRYRFIYRKEDLDRVGVEFDIAPPGKPDSFAKYAEGFIRRR